MSFNLDDYQTVDHRLEEFFAKYPDGSIQSEIVEHTDSRVTVKALAYRSPSDLVPGIGLSSLAIPGSTPYTRGSELENAETSARGRALVALGFGSKASRDEIQSKAGAPSSAPQGQATDAAVSRPESPAPAAASPAQAIVQKAQEAAKNLRANQRPDIPVDLGGGKFQVTTNVTFVDEAHGEKNGKPWTRYDVHISVAGDDLTLATFSETLAQACRDLAGTTAHITYVEKQNGKYTNRTLEAIEPAPELAQAFAGIAIDGDIPFGPVIW